MYRPIQFQERYIALSAMLGGASKSMTKDEYFKLCPTLVQEQVYAWSLHHLLSALGSPPGMADARFLKLNWSIGDGRWGDLPPSPPLDPFYPLPVQCVI